MLRSNLLPIAPQAYRLQAAADRYTAQVCNQPACTLPIKPLRSLTAMLNFPVLESVEILPRCNQTVACLSLNPELPMIGLGNRSYYLSYTFG